MACPTAARSLLSVVLKTVWDSSSWPRGMLNKGEADAVDTTATEVGDVHAVQQVIQARGGERMGAVTAR